MKNQSEEAKVLRAFDSFRLLDAAEVKAATAKKVSAATPKELPQSPVAAKLKSDADDRNIKSAVKSVLTETARYNLKNEQRKPKPEMLEEFDKNGRLLKQTEFDSFGSPHKVGVYGFVAGKRAASFGHVDYEYSPGGVAIAFPAPGKFDRRFDESYAYKYLGNNLIEERTTLSNGFLYRRTVHRYLKGKKETLYYDGGTTPFGKVTSLLDEQGNEIESIYYDYDKGKSVEKARYKIEYITFDERGNWTKRTTYKRYGNEKPENCFLNLRITARLLTTNNYWKQQIYPANTRPKTSFKLNGNIFFTDF